MFHTFSNAAPCAGYSPGGSRSAPGAYLTGVSGVLAMVLLAKVFIFAMHTSSLAGSRTGSVVTFMNGLAQNAIQANQSIDQAQLEEIIRNNVDVQRIGNYALGSYLAQLRAAEMNDYYDGVINFMARYAAMQSRRYQIESAEFYGPSYHKDNTITLKSRVTLAGGTSYRVKWKLAKIDGEFKVLDARVLGFWLTPLQRRMFREYIRENNHDVQALLNVLAR